MSDVEAPPFNDEQIDIIAQVIADLRAEWQADLARAINSLRSDLERMINGMGDQIDLHQSLGELRGQLSVLMGGEKSIEASEIVRKLKVTKRE